MYCPNCSKRADYNFCPHCGYDMRSILASKAEEKRSAKKNYDAYMRYYPDKMQAIQALRVDTGMGAAEAIAIIDQLFGPDPNAFSEEELLFYARQHYPDKAKAIQALRRETGIGAVDAQEAMDRAFQKLEGKSSNRSAQAAKAVGKGVGLAALGAGFTGLSIIAKLTKRYMK